ncbi:MAG TPA: hypothetical protein VMG31_01800 [Verrucomicrobiae bacterium]|nr:hypothetical protein [Verrucomicrobiae bacterium]
MRTTSVFIQHPQRRFIRSAVALFVVAFTVRAILALSLQHFDVPIKGEMERVAATWAVTGQLANPYSTRTGRTAHVSPVYPILLGLIYRVFGIGVSGHRAQAIFACAVSAARSPMLLLLALILGLDFRTGMIAGCISVAYITAFNTELRGSWEAPLAGLFLIALTMMAARFHGAPELRFRTAVVFGLSAGVGVLLSPALAPPMAVFLVCTARFGRHRWGRYAAWCSVLFVAAFLVVLPWLIRNERALGSPVIRSNFGLELSLAYNDREYASALDPAITASHPLMNRAVSQHVAEIGEIAFNREREHEAIQWIRQHPEGALRLFGDHVFDFWFPPNDYVFARILLAVITVLSACGFVLLVLRNHLAAWLIGSIWASFPLIYYVTYWSSRYREPIEWTFLLCSAVTLDFVWREVRSFRPRRVEPFPPREFEASKLRS